MEKDMYKVFDFDEFSSSDLQRNLNEFAKDGYFANFTDLKRQKGLLHGVVILNLADDSPAPEFNSIGFINSTKGE